MDGNWVLIYSTSQFYKAEIIKGMLEEQEIAAVVVNKQDSAYFFGEVEVFVPADCAIKAKRLVNEQKDI